MLICLKVKTLDSQTYDFTVDNEISVRQFKETIAEKTNISADLQRIIYCGRVLSDEKQLKEYDVSGKVVHVVERPPPSSRITANIIDTNNRRQRDGLDANIRASPIFRALDGMVVGAMTIPVNAAGGQTGQRNIPPLNPSSSFCMNRITVARHMLDCANNIALYLENPERGLNNTSLDILTQGRWTMESTVVEVGISAAGNIDMPQNQNIVEAFHGAVSAALHTTHPNVTVVQFPSVFTTSSGAISSPQSAGGQPNVIDRTPPTTEPSNDRSENVNVQSSSGSTTPLPQGSQIREGSNESNQNSGNSTQRTSTATLGEVIQQMRTVQNRLEPFIQQYYDILMNDPPFNVNDEAFFENAQRIVDRVSEALHYMSHAQHAISDLMLDLSQNTPRHLFCRPILVEQGGFVSSNNYLASFLQPNGNNNESAASNNDPAGNPPMNLSTSTSTRPSPPSTRPSPPSTRPPHPTTRPLHATRPTPTTRPPPHTTQPSVPASGQRNSEEQTTPSPGEQPRAASGQGQFLNQANINARVLQRILSPLFLPMQTRVPPTTSANTNSESGNQDEQPVAEIVVNLGPRRILAPSPQFQVARLIQAVVNSAPLDADLHVQINAPNLLGFGVPVNTAVTQQPPVQSHTSSQTPVSNNTDSSADSSQPRVTTATHPTTSTQTRSTARPQVHIANIPSSQMWNARVIPANMLSSFDRFLPCNSHHIRDNEMNEANVVNGTARNRQNRQRRQPQESSPTSTTTGNTPNVQQQTATTQSPSPPDNNFNFSSEAFNIPINLFGNNITLRDLIINTPSPSILNRMRSELQTFIVNNLFAGAPISDENMNNAINQVIQLLSNALIFLSQYDLPDYDARASVENFIRNSLPFIINLIWEDNSNEFGARFIRELITFVRRFFVILVTCVGRSNAELYLDQLVQMAINSNNPLEQEALRILHRHLMAVAINELDLARQNISDVQEFLVIRRPGPENQSSEVTAMETEEVIEGNNVESGSESQPQQSQSQPQTQPQPHPQTQTNVANSLSRARIYPVPEPLKFSEPLPSVVPGSETWHANFPSSWLPIITRDIEKQRRQSPQAPFSDAYISGMSAKRRKIITSSKPPADIPSLLSDGVRRAMQVAGVTGPSTAASVDEISSAISNDVSAQTSYREALRSHFQERLRTDPDFSPEKFPSCSKYFKE